jgi:selenocysteine lyase/cysteine desulfurase
MAFSSRRKFIKKNLLGGLLFAAGAPLLANRNPEAADKKTLPGFLNEKDEIDWALIREQFLLSEKKHYFNTGSLGPSPRVVVDEVCDMMRKLEKQAYVGHHYTKEPHEKLASFLNASPDEIAITRNSTEGMNIVARSLPLEPGDEVLITDQEHIGGAAPWVALQKDKGVVVKLVELDLTGENNLQIIKDHITDKTKVVSFSHIVFTTGMRLPAKEIVDVCREKGIYSVVDGAQAVGMIPLDMKDMNPDFYIGSGHKWLFGPKGTGVLFINKTIIGKCDPVFVGAYTDKKFDLKKLTLEYRAIAQREEYGTRNTPIIIGLGTAVDFIEEIGIERVETRGRYLADRFIRGMEEVPGVEILTPKNPEYSACIVSIRVEGMDAQKVSLQLSQEQIIKLRAVFEYDINALRASFSVFNSPEEVDMLVNSLKAVITG